ncbi:MAG: isoprenylcysteine carboxylmethyltransferase family protein [Gemmatimonadota bacterium]|nr:isoprenylcysteine carboxylmethyltransferase family protein [Gemmatimonadota bacterium]
MDSVRYVLALLIVLTLPPSVAWWYILHLFVTSWRKIRPASTILMLLTLGFVSVVSLYSVQGLLIGQDLGANGILAGLGGFLILLSWGIAVLRSRHLTAKTMLGIPELQADGRGGKLVTQGPYSVIRHPRSVELIFGISGAAFLANWSGTYLVVVVCFVTHHGAVLLEERELLDRFGEEYENYRKRVPRYIPRIRKWRTNTRA